MFDPMLPMRLAQMTGEMMWRQSAANAQMWSQMMTGGAGMWGLPAAGNDADLRGSRRTVRSWYRQPDTESVSPPWAMIWQANPLAMLMSNPAPASMPPAATDMPAALMAAWQPWLRFWSQSAPQQANPLSMLMSSPAMAAMPSMPKLPGLPGMPAAMMAAWQPWLGLWSQAAPPQSWPMAMMLMGAGFPQAAAWPTAEAGAHVLAATAKAVEGIEQMFASYRSDGGHAIAQIVRPRRFH